MQSTWLNSTQRIYRGARRSRVAKNLGIFPNCEEHRNPTFLHWSRYWMLCGCKMGWTGCKPAFQKQISDSSSTRWWRQDYPSLSASHVEKEKKRTWNEQHWWHIDTMRQKGCTTSGPTFHQVTLITSRGWSWLSVLYCLLSLKINAIITKPWQVFEITLCLDYHGHWRWVWWRSVQSSNMDHHWRWLQVL